MTVTIKVPYDTMRSYRRFCILLLSAIKSDMRSNLSLKKLRIRKKLLDEALSDNLDYYNLYVRLINSMYLSWDEEGRYYKINLDQSLKVRNYKLIFIWKIIEYGAKGITPYPFFRMSFIKYNKILEEVYSNYCKEGKVDLFIRRSDYRRSQISARR